MVCLGNICRSPLAEGILKHKVKQAGLNWEVESAGTAGHNPGCPPHRLSQKIARLNGFDIHDQVCRQLEPEDILRFDKIYVMDRMNLRDCKHIFARQWNPAKVDLLMNELEPGSNKEIPDPWFGGEEGYHQVYEMISKACDAIISRYSVSNTAHFNG